MPSRFLDSGLYGLYWFVAWVVLTGIFDREVNFPQAVLVALVAIAAHTSGRTDAQT